MKSQKSHHPRIKVTIQDPRVWREFFFNDPSCETSEPSFGAELRRSEPRCSVTLASKIETLSTQVFHTYKQGICGNLPICNREAANVARAM